MTPRSYKPQEPRSGVAIFDLDYDAILAAMYALYVSAEGDCYLCVPPGPGIEAAALGASESALPGTAPVEALHTFTLDSGASRCFFRDSTTLTPLSAPVPVRLADPSRGPVPSRSLSGLHLPSFFTNLVSASGLVTPPCSYRLLLHQTLLWHHCLGHPSLPRLRGMHSRLLVSGLPRSLPPFPPSPAPPFLLCGCECYFLLVVDDCTRYTTVFPLRSKGEGPDVLVPWIRAVRLQLCERFRQDLPALRLHSDRGGEFSFDLLREFCRGEGTLQSFMLPASPQQNGIAKRCIGLVMEVVRTSMIHAVAPHFLWPFAVRYAAHQLNLWPRVSLPETSPTLRWMGKVGDASVFLVWGSRAFVRDTCADKLSARAIPYVFLGFPPDAPGWQFYHPTSRRVLHSQDVMLDESVPFYHPVEPVEVAVDSGAARGGATRGAASGGAEPAGVGPGGTEPACSEPGVAESEGAEPGGAEPERAEPRGAEPGGALSTGGPLGALSRWEPLSPPQLREWFARRTRLRSGAAGAGGSIAGGTGAPVPGGSGALGAGGAAGVEAGGTGARAAGGTGAVGPRGDHTRGTGAAGVGDGGTGPGAFGTTRAGGAAGVGARDPGAGDTGARGAGPGGVGAVGAGSGDTGRPRLYFVPLLQKTGGLTERREPVSRPTLPVRTGRRVPRPCPPPVPGTQRMELHPSSIPQCVLLPSPPASSLADSPDPKSNLVRAASPTVPRLLASVVTGPSFESTAASALVAKLIDFAAACRLDYAASLVAESESDCPPSVGGECALGTDVFEERQEDFEYFAAAVPHLVSMLIAPEGDRDAQDILTPRSYAEAITGPYSSQWQTTMDAEMASWKSTGTYVDAVPPSGANIVDGMRIFRVKRPLGSPPVFKARYVARGFSQRRGVLQRFGFRYSSPQSTSLPTGHSLSAPPSDESVEPSGRYSDLVGCLITSGIGLVLGGRGPVVIAVHADASWVDDLATHRSSQGSTFSLCSGSVSWRSTGSSCVLSSSCEAEIYAGAMAAQELRWLTYLLTDLGEQPRSSPFLYVNNKAMIALC
ncbi:unnamed protein product [Closterium sp. NIES-53]